MSCCSRTEKEFSQCLSFSLFLFLFQLQLSLDRRRFDLAYLGVLAGGSGVEENLSQSAIHQIRGVCEKIRNGSGGTGDDMMVIQQWSEALQQYEHPLAKEHSNLLERLEFLIQCLKSSPEDHKLQRQKFFG